MTDRTEAIALIDAAIAETKARIKAGDYSDPMNAFLMAPGEALEADLSLLVVLGGKREAILAADRAERSADFMDPCQ